MVAIIQTSTWCRRFFWVSIIQPQLAGLSKRGLHCKFQPNCPQCKPTLHMPRQLGLTSFIREERLIEEASWHWVLPITGFHVTDVTSDVITSTWSYTCMSFLSPNFPSPGSGNITKDKQACFSSTNISLTGAFDFMDACESCPGLCSTIWYKIAVAKTKHKDS